MKEAGARVHVGLRGLSRQMCCNAVVTGCKFTATCLVGKNVWMSECACVTDGAWTADWKKKKTDRSLPSHVAAKMNNTAHWSVTAVLPLWKQHNVVFLPWIDWLVTWVTSETVTVVPTSPLQVHDKMENNFVTFSLGRKAHSFGHTLLFCSCKHHGGKKKRNIVCKCLSCHPCVGTCWAPPTEQLLRRLRSLNQPPLIKGWRPPLFFLFFLSHRTPRCESPANPAPFTRPRD